MERWENGNFKRILILGLPGCGKSGTLFREVIPTYINSRVKPGQNVRILAFDTEMNKNYINPPFMKDESFDARKKQMLKRYLQFPVPICNLNEVIGAKGTKRQWKDGMVRVMPGPDERGGDFMDASLSELDENKKIADCLAVLEDSARFMPANGGFDKRLKNTLINLKQRRSDLVLFFHFWDDVPPGLIKWMDILYLHKSDTSVAYRSDRLGEGKLNKILEAEKRVNAHPSKFYHEKIILVQ